MNATFIFFTQEKKFISAMYKLDVRQNTSLQVSILFFDLLTNADREDFLYYVTIPKTVSNFFFTGGGRSVYKHHRAV